MIIGLKMIYRNLDFFWNELDMIVLGSVLIPMLILILVIIQPDINVGI